MVRGIKQVQDPKNVFGVKNNIVLNSINAGFEKLDLKIRFLL